MQLLHVKAAESHFGCLLCSKSNPMSMHLDFYADQAGTVYAEFQTNSYLQGYKGILHGGVTCALLDSAMTHCLFNLKIEGLTGEMKIKFVKPIPINSKVILKAMLEKQYDPLYIIKADLYSEEILYASASAKFIRK
ncbi:MAG: PaaI family thioesterase [Candidatus Riflebacteria bacterium]|nr:PaaI family thioesterase [Candidatus Riflebacteria bacterium]